MLMIYIFSCLLFITQSMEAGGSGASGLCVVQTAIGSAAENARLLSPSMEDDSVTGWPWQRQTARAASARRVGIVICLKSRKNS